MRAGGSSRDSFGTACGQSGGGYEGFRFGEGETPADDALLLLEPEGARRYAIAVKKIAVVAPPEAGRPEKPTGVGTTATGGNGATDEPGQVKPPPARAKSFRGTVDVPAGTAKFKLVQVADEIVTLLAGDAGAAVRVTVEVVADFPAGVADGTKRSVSENAATLGFKVKDWE